MGLGIVGLLLQPIHLHTQSRVWDSGLVLLRQVELVMLLKMRANLVLTSGLDDDIVVCWYLIQ